MNLANNMAPGVSTAEGPDQPANASTREAASSDAMPNPMQSAHGKQAGMALAMRSTTRAERAAIVQAVLDGLDPIEARRAEDALARVRFVWPSTAPARVLGAIMSHLSRRGRIVEDGWTKGRTGRSRAGRVSMWLKATP